MEGWVVSVFNV